MSGSSTSTRLTPGPAKTRTGPTTLNTSSTWSAASSPSASGPSPSSPASRPGPILRRLPRSPRFAFVAAAGRNEAMTLGMGTAPLKMGQDVRVRPRILAVASSGSAWGGFTPPGVRSGGRPLPDAGEGGVRGPGRSQGRDDPSPLPLPHGERATGGGSRRAALPRPRFSTARIRWRTWTCESKPKMHSLGERDESPTRFRKEANPAACCPGQHAVAPRSPARLVIAVDSARLVSKAQKN